MTGYHTIYLFGLSQESLDLGEINNSPILTIKPIPIGKRLQAFQSIRRDIACPHLTIKN